MDWCLWSMQLYPHKSTAGRNIHWYGLTCTVLTLFYETKDTKYLDAADCLIQDVHNTLGKERSLKHRLGSSTDDDPLLGGLRIGKADPEGYPDGDGQYFHYLTKWMFALNRMSIAKNNPKYNRWAIQLAESIHPHFVYNRESSRPKMYWKISIGILSEIRYCNSYLHLTRYVTSTDEIGRKLGPIWRIHHIQNPPRQLSG